GKITASYSVYRLGLTTDTCDKKPPMQRTRREAGTDRHVVVCCNATVNLRMCLQKIERGAIAALDRPVATQARNDAKALAINSREEALKPLIVMIPSDAF